MNGSLSALLTACIWAGAAAEAPVPDSQGFSPFDGVEEPLAAPSSPSSPHTWAQEVARDPELGRLQLKSRLLVPGIVFLGLGVNVLAIGGAVVFTQGLLSGLAVNDDCLEETGPCEPSSSPDAGPDDAAVALVVSIPTVFLVAGAAMTAIGAIARRKLGRRRTHWESSRRVHLSAFGSLAGGGLTLSGRF